MLYTQKKTIEIINASNSTYVMPIKGVHLCGIKAANSIIGQFSPKEIHYCEENKHGRSNSWTVCSYPLEKNQKGFELYENAKMLYSIYRTDSRYKDGTTIFYLTNHYFENNTLFLKQVRTYWNIENLLHYERDVRFKQDNNRIKNPNDAVIFAVLNTIAINLLRDKVGYSITDAIDWAKCNQIKFHDLVRM
jgi:predicted transposase YbfD/YdcC